MNIEQNIKIAEFMGYKFGRIDKVKYTITKPKETEYYFGSHETEPYDDEIEDSLSYHKDWSLLMPVVEKIESLAPTSGYYDFIVKIFGRISYVLCYYENIPTEQMLTDHRRLNTKIDSVYDCISQFIEWYNKIK